MLLLVTNAYSQTLTRSYSGHLFLTEGCNKIDETLDGLNQWTKQQWGTSCESLPLLNVGEGYCRYDLHSCLPDSIKQIQGLTSQLGGPNCWNFALKQAGLIPSLRESNEKEFDFFMSSPLCQKLSIGEVPRPGDIGSIENHSDDSSRLMHAFIHVSPKMVYAKHSISTDSPFGLMSYKEMKLTYPVGQIPGGECRTECGPQKIEKYLGQDEIKKMGTIPDSSICDHAGIVIKDKLLKKACAKIQAHIEENRLSCERSCTKSQLVYYRCSSLKNYLSLKSLTSTSLDLMDTLEAQLEKSIMTENGLGQDEVTTLVLELKNLYEKLEVEDNNTFIQDMIKVRLMSVNDQINSLQLSYEKEQEFSKQLSVIIKFLE